MRKIRVTVGTVGFMTPSTPTRERQQQTARLSVRTLRQSTSSLLASLNISAAQSADEADDQEVTGHLAKNQLEEMTIQQLQNLAGDLGVDVTGCKRKPIMWTRSQPQK